MWCMVGPALELYWLLKVVHSLARSQGSLPPVFHAQTRDLLKITQITRQHQGIMLEGNGGNLEVHCPNTHPLLSQTLKGHRRALVKWQDFPLGKERHEAEQPLVIGHLPLGVCHPMNQGKPATHLFFQRDDSGDHLLQGEGFETSLEGKGNRGTTVLQQ